MFTGIVEQLAAVTSIERRPGRTVRLSLNLGKSARGVRLGDSVAVNGVCLTVTAVRKGVVSFDAIEETLRVTNLGELTKGAEVNVERGLAMGERIDGHLVTGHIDGTGRIHRMKPLTDGSVKVTIQTRTALAAMMVPKGSVAVDGISLTLVDVASKTFSFCVIPHTLSMTTLGRKKVGDSVNVEIDLIGKYVQRLLQQKIIGEHMRKQVHAARLLRSKTTHALDSAEMIREDRENAH